ncbi:hypothetical protein [Shewanella sp. GD03713]|uniref:hypothetical protein n=1 Tax=Shewanella sp. GD03713 TaxID=2975372 RepID=UPI000F6BD971|nr:hypothetical protein [Shewanella sp. GD03713]MDH1470440.1 hypothetical protein [Shewanella sp. GD03713]QXN23212.1 hypothetical protein KVP08_011120 [Shewanella putrefaciens]VEE64378.1 Uncharacterised protein [Shewanella putrefaciens]
MDGKTIQDILGIQFSPYSDGTDYSRYSESEKQQMVTAALLELYRAEALGGGGSANSVNTNLKNLAGHIELVMSALKQKD